MEPTNGEFKGFQLHKRSDGELQRNLKEPWRQPQESREALANSRAGPGATLELRCQHAVLPSAALLHIPIAQSNSPQHPQHRSSPEAPALLAPKTQP